MNAYPEPTRSPPLASRWRRTACAALLGLAASCVGAADAPRLAPLVYPPTAEHRVGKFIFATLVTPDLGVAKRFYGGLFGWTFSDLQTGSTSYTEAMVDGAPVAGFVQRALRPGEPHQPAWLSLIAVDDMDAARKTALKGGARVLSEPHDWPGRGRVAVYADPQGAVFGMLALNSGDPKDELAAPGEWIWRSLFTSDPDAGAAFYQSVFDYEVFDLPDSGAGVAAHTILSSDGYARGSVNGLPPNWTQAHAHWLNFVRVVDAAQSAARAVALGGRMLLAPRPDRHGGNLAIVADPLGAPLGLLEWSESQDAKAAP
jgi:predicted enzyme related to lactoylglutathione lyase